MLVVMVFCAGCMLDTFKAHGVEKTLIMKFYIENFLDLRPRFFNWFNFETKKQPTVCDCCLGSLGDIASHIAQYRITIDVYCHCITIMYFYHA